MENGHYPPLDSLKTSSLVSNTSFHRALKLAGCSRCFSQPRVIMIRSTTTWNFAVREANDDLLAHGMQVMIQTAAGAGTFPSEVADSLLGMIEVSGRFLHPVYRGNTLYPMLEIVELKDQNTTGVITMHATIHNQNDVLVFEGTQRYLIRKRVG